MTAGGVGSPQAFLAGIDDPPSGSLLVALSGGADSAFAAWVALALTPAQVRAIHVHHGTTAADQLADAAMAVAEAVGCGLEMVHVEVPEGPSWEAQARQARWSALFAKAEPGEVIVTGHHRDDLAETTLGNLLRGAGAAGLAAFAAARDDIWRPLIRLSRAQVRDRAETLQLPFTDDPSNDDPAFTRNRLRQAVLPQLAVEAPHVANSLARTAESLASDDATLEAQVEVVVGEDPWGAHRIGAALVQTAEPAVAARMVRRLLRAANPPYAGTSADVAAVLAVARCESSADEVGSGLRATREGPWLVIHRGAPNAPNPVNLAIPGEVSFGPLTVRVAGAASVLTRRTALLNPDTTGAELLLRPAVEGERIEIAAGSKPVRDVMAEAGIPARVRSAWPVAEAHGRIVAVAGVRSARWARGTLGADGTVELAVRERQR